MDNYAATRPFRFFDNREKYLLFVTTCSEKWVIAERVGMELKYLQPVPPALRVFDAGMGDATVLSQVMRQLHYRFPTIPFLIVGKEISQEDVRISLEKMADRFYEHPQTVLVVTNLFYGEAPGLFPRSAAMQAKLNWWDVPLQGTSAYEFDRQIKDLQAYLRHGWQTTTSARTGNPVYVTPSVLILYRADQQFVLEPIIPQQGQRHHAYDLVIASQPFRARLPADIKVRNVLAPLASALAPGGRMITVHLRAKIPAWRLFAKSGLTKIRFKPHAACSSSNSAHSCNPTSPICTIIITPTSAPSSAILCICIPQEVSSSIGTSTLLAAWNAAIYVAQIEDDRVHEAMSRGDYLHATQDVLRKYQALWFTDESFVVTRQRR